MVKSIIQRDVVAMIAFQLDLQLSAHWVPITTKVVSSDPFRRGVLDATLYDTVCQLLAKCWWFTLGIPVYSANKNDRHDIAVESWKRIKKYNIPIWKFLFVGLFLLENNACIARNLLRRCHYNQTRNKSTTKYKHYIAHFNSFPIIMKFALSIHKCRS
jgi:hypothetical protein